MGKLDKLPITKLKGGFSPKYILTEDYKFEFQYGVKRAYFIIPSGFEYDGATFGSFLFWRKSMHEEPVTLAHDWGYINLGKVNAKYANHALIGDLSKGLLDDIWLQEARRTVNVQDWRTKVASAAFKTVGALLRKRRELING